MSEDERAGRKRASLSKYFGRNWGVSFILASVILFLIAALLPYLGREVYVEEVAGAGAIYLVIGVALQFLAYARREPEKVKSYLRENWGAPFVVAFMGLLISAAGYLALGNEAFANELAVYAYYCLVAGVVLQLASYIRSERKGQAKPDDEY